jgi:predicted RNA-binding Zn ribbon-like protein
MTGVDDTPVMMTCQTCSMVTEPPERARAMSLPAWYPFAEEEKPAPMPLLLVQAFLNTRHFEVGSDLLSNPDTARQWLVDTHLLPRAATLTAAELELASSMRESIRGLLNLRRGEQQGAHELGPLRELANARSACLCLDDHGRLSVGNPRHNDLRDGMFDLLLIVRDAQERGSWSRLKVCDNSECRWVFYDRSRNQQGRWCEMAVCGNRVKNRAFRARRR